MTHVSRSRTIAAARQTVWAVLADFGALSVWAHDVSHSCLLRATGPIGLQRRVQVGPLTLVETIVEFDAPRALAYRVQGLPTFAGTVQNRWELSQLGEQSTGVTLTTTVDAGSVVVEHLVCRVSATQSDGLLTGLAHHLEATRV